MNFKEFIEQEEKKEETPPSYFKSLLPTLHIQPKNVVDFYDKNPVTLSNFIYKNGKVKASLNTVLLNLSDELKGLKAQVFTHKGNAAIIYTKDKKQIFKKPSEDHLRKDVFPLSTQTALDIALQSFGKQAGSSKLGGSFGAGVV
jgi:ribosomal protein S18